MTKELMKKVIESGIVPAQAVKLMKRWQLLDEDMPESARQAATEEQLMELVTDVASLLEDTEELPEIRETMLDVTDSVFQQQAWQCVVSAMEDGWPRKSVSLYTMTDAHGCYFFPAGMAAVAGVCRVGDVIWDRDAVFYISEVMQIYVGEGVRFLRCRVSGVDPGTKRLLEERHAQVLQLRGDDSES